MTGSWPCFSSCNATGGGGAASHLRGELPADGDTGGLPSSREQRVSSPSSSRSQGMVSLGRGACCCTSAGQRNGPLARGARPGRDGGSSPGCRVARIPGRVLPCGWTPGPLSPWHREAFQTQPGGSCGSGSQQRLSGAGTGRDCHGGRGGGWGGDAVTLKRPRAPPPGEGARTLHLWGVGCASRAPASHPAGQRGRPRGRTAGPGAASGRGPGLWGRERRVPGGTCWPRDVVEHTGDINAESRGERPGLRRTRRPAGEANAGGTRVPTARGSARGSARGWRRVTVPRRGARPCGRGRALGSRPGRPRLPVQEAAAHLHPPILRKPRKADARRGGGQAAPRGRGRGARGRPGDAGSSLPRLAEGPRDN